MTDSTSAKTGCTLATERLQSYQRAAHRLVDTMHAARNMPNLQKTLHAEIDDLSERHKQKIAMLPARKNQGKAIQKAGRTEVRRFLGATASRLQRAGLKDAHKHFIRFEQIDVWEKALAPIETPLTGLIGPDRQATLLADCVPQDSPGLVEEWLRMLEPEDQWPEWFRELPPLVRTALISRLKACEIEILIARDLGWNSQQPRPFSRFLNTIPSSLRCIPGLANLRRHEVQINGRPVIVSFSHGVLTPIDIKHKKERLRLGFQNAAQVLTLAMTVRSTGARAAQSPGAGDPIALPVLFQTLLSPGSVSSLIGRFNPNQNDTRQYEEKEQVVEVLRYALAHPHEPVREDWLKAALKTPQGEQRKAPTYREALASLGFAIEASGYLKHQGLLFKPIVFSTNYPFNGVGRLNQRLPFAQAPHLARNTQNRRILIQVAAQTLAQAAPPSQHQRILHTQSGGGTLPNAVKSLDRLLKICAQIKWDKPQAKQLLDALDAYRDALSYPKSLGRRRHLMLASLEDIIVHEMGGIPTGSCKSGKDRFGAKTLHTQAIILYRAQYGALPRYSDKQPDRAQFNNILAAVYCTGHHQESAARNAPGAKGIMKPEQLFARDTCRVIEQQVPGLMKQDNALSGMNKPKPLSAWEAVWLRIRETCRAIWHKVSRLLHGPSPEEKLRATFAKMGDSRRLSTVSHVPEESELLDTPEETARIGKNLQLVLDPFPESRQSPVPPASETLNGCRMAFEPDAESLNDASHPSGGHSHEQDVPSEAEPGDSPVRRFTR